MNDAIGENTSSIIISTTDEVVINNNNNTSSKKTSSAFRWLRYHFSIPKACIFIECILIGNAMVEAAILGLLMVYLTDESEKMMTVFKAATLVNILEGMSGLFCIYTTYIKEHRGCYPTVLFSSICYIAGLVALALLSMSWFGFGTGIFFLIVGKTFSKSSCAEDFLEDQLKAQSNGALEDEKRDDDVRINVSLIRSRIVGVILGNVLVVVVNSWNFKFIISASIQTITLVLFLIGTPLYFMGRFQSMVHYWNLFNKVIITKDYSSSSSSSERRLCTVIRCSSSSSGHQEAAKAGTKSRRRRRSSLPFLLFSSSMVPLCSTFLMIGVIDSTGSTYFLEQGSTMDSGVPVTILQIVMHLVRFSSKYLVHRFLSNRRLRGTTHATLIRIGVGMLFSIGVCSIAQVMEVKRLDVVRKNNLLYKPEEVVPMSIFWLLPQFICLGAMNGLATDGLEDFFQDELPDWLKSYASAFTEALIGIGTLVSAFLLLIMKEVSELKGHNGWFAGSKNINKNRLDHVYRTLTVFSLLNLLLFAYASTSYIIHGENNTGGDVSFIDEPKIEIVPEVDKEEPQTEVEQEEEEPQTLGGDGQDKVK